MRSLLYRAVRELLVNVSKHAHAKHVSVDVRQQESEISITVADDGKGFNPAEIKSAEAGGFGLFSIRQRLAHIGGKLTIESGEGKGTRVTLIAPLSPE
jgi:signal transduction histidine kinase